MKETIEARDLSGNNSDQFFNIYTIAAKNRKDVLAERLPAANDVLRRSMMIYSEFLPENGFHGMRQRGMADIVQEGSCTQQAALRSPYVAPEAVQTCQLHDPETVLVARVADCAGFAVRPRD